MKYVNDINYARKNHGEARWSARCLNMYLKWKN